MKHPTSPTPSESGSMMSGYSFRSNRSHLPRPANANLCTTATSKTTKYLRRLIKFRQMDFEFAIWQMLYLFVAPQKVYRNFGYRKGSKSCTKIVRFKSCFDIFLETKSQFARDDPAFLVLLLASLCCKTMLSIKKVDQLDHFSLSFSYFIWIRVPVQLRILPNYLLHPLRSSC